MSKNFFLVTETSFHASYLVTKWVKSFHNIAGFSGVIVRDDPRPKEQLACKRFHLEHQGETMLAREAMQQLQEFYPHLSETEYAMIDLFGVPELSATGYPNTIFLGPNLNTIEVRSWLADICKSQEVPFLFIFLDQLLDSWWIELTHGQIINGHSAVLPYARGMYALENMAILQNIESFRRAAGATVHYIDTGIDTGPIIRAERLKDPFFYKSIWLEKGCIFILVFDLLIQVALDVSNKPYMVPVGTSADFQIQGPIFVKRYFTREAHKSAEEGYAKMRYLIEITRNKI